MSNHNDTGLHNEHAATIALAIDTIHANLPSLAASAARKRGLNDDRTSLLHALMEEISVEDVRAAVLAAARRLNED